ncbi:MAG: carboxypeptidase regulatory-like domain-containing protein [Acidobacteriaceae bacterium]|nr:carboxypeptidase regulatory-like domain-containing protein [Acidobacteriaceae bacterium]
MNRWKYVPSFAVMVFLLLAGAAAQSVKFKSLDGKVLGNGDAPLASAIVYLQDSRSNSIRTFIATQDGSYRFGQIAPDLDYTVWAKYKDAKSPTKNISAYDSRKQLTIDLHIKADK